MWPPPAHGTILAAGSRDGRLCSGGRRELVTSDIVPRDDLVTKVAETLAIDTERADRILAAFDQFIAAPLVKKFQELQPSDLAKRNPFVYAALGVQTIEQWTNRVLNDILTSSAEGLVGNWLEEVAIIMSGSAKHAGGADIVRELPNGVVELYAIQSTTNTKNAGGGRSDQSGLDAAARALRAQRRHVDLFIGYLFGRKRTTQLRGVTRLSSVDFWTKMTGDAAFLPKLLRACAVIAPARLGKPDLGAQRLSDDLNALFLAESGGGVDWVKLLTAKAPPRPKKD